MILDGRAPGSYRDPSGFVFFHEGRVLRTVDEERFRLIEQLDSDGILTRLEETHGLVRTKIVDDRRDLDVLGTLHSEVHGYLEHERITPITYPYEWTFSMLADAAICTLDLQMELTRAGYALKDATPFNVQFVRGRPTFIDVASIECPSRLDLWFALGQFLRTFLYPLLLCRYRGWDLQSFFLARPDGRTIDEVARAFSWLDRLRPMMLLDLTAPYWLQCLSGKNSSRQRGLLAKRDSKSEAQLLNLRRLKRKVVRLASGYKPRSDWSAYKDRCNYTRAAEKAKKEVIGDFVSETRPATVLDVGCNTGDYSFVSADCGAKVVAIDSDHDAVELVYGRLRGKPMDVTPLVVDLSNPSPGIGYMNTERSPLLQRAKADCVLCLALIHHLLITANLSLAAVRDLLASLTTRDVVLEFVPPDDPMFQTLLQLRVDLFQDLTLERCRSVFGERFSVLKEVHIQESTRTLLFLRRRS